MAVSAAEVAIVNARRPGAGTDVIDSSSCTHFDGILSSLGQIMVVSFLFSLSFLLRAVRLSIQLQKAYMDIDLVK